MLCHKILRQRWVLGVIFFCSLFYFLATTFSKRQDLVSEDYVSNGLKRTLRQPFQWVPLPDVEKNYTQVRLCRNSQQGKSLIVDEKGYVCGREELDSIQCCDAKHSLVTRYVCESCLPNGCCSVYEHCVSCCLQPDKQPLLRRILKEAAVETFEIFASEVKDQFELCLAKCRTSSQSVQHENSYRHPNVKYCYGDKPPDLQVVVS
ncbi:SREBP regulating gene protein-like [Littorina saxatilis]|uniref:SREBP regulating gene protein n=1 Tax=Littorina saxatilis TaxID=31220 RepID=A0AAN9AJR0_9CAEN